MNTDLDHVHSYTHMTQATHNAHLLEKNCLSKLARYTKSHLDFSNIHYYTILVKFENVAIINNAYLNN